MVKNFLKDIVKYIPGQIVPAIVGFISIPIITRLFPPQDYGHYSLAMATVMVLTTLLGWLPMGIIRFYPSYERDNKLDVFYGNIVKLTLISLLIVTVSFSLTLFTIKHDISSKLYLLMFIGIGVFIVTAIFDVCQYLLRSKREVGWYSGFAIWKSIMGFGLGLLLIVLFKLNVESLFLGIILSIVIALPLLWRKVTGSIFVMPSKINPQLFKEMAKYSFPLVLGNLAAWILSLSDRYILELFRESQEVGIYSASYNIADRCIMFIVYLFMLASGPISIHIWEKEGQAKSIEFVNKTTRYYLIACVPAVIGLSVLSEPIMNIMAGEQYFEGYKIIPFVASGILFLGLQQKFQAGFIFYKKTSFIAFLIVASGLLNLFLNFSFIPKYGYFAAAITTLISYSFLLFLMVIFSRRFFVWKFPFKSLVKVICASGIMGMAVYFVSNSLSSSVVVNLISGVCSGIVLYFLILLLLREFSKEELQFIHLLKQKVLK
jgi:O-antigen/teichoic acid export membrane protein